MHNYPLKNSGITYFLEFDTIKNNVKQFFYLPLKEAVMNNLSSFISHSILIVTIAVYYLLQKGLLDCGKYKCGLLGADITAQL